MTDKEGRKVIVCDNGTGFVINIVILWYNDIPLVNYIKMENPMHTLILGMLIWIKCIKLGIKAWGWHNM